MREPLKLRDVSPSVRPFEASKLAEPQRSAAPPPANAEAARTEVSAWDVVASPNTGSEEDASVTGPTGELCGLLQNSREMEISLSERTGS